VHPLVIWLGEAWRSFHTISFLYVAPALAFLTLQTVFAAASWFGILRYAFPDGGVRGVRVLACYSTGVALNGFLPAKAGSLVALGMFVATIGGAALVTLLAAFVVQGLFFGAIEVIVIAYLFVTDGSSFALKWAFVPGDRWKTALAVVGVVALMVALLVLARGWLRRAWEQAKRGGGILFDPSAYLTRVCAPQFLSWCCRFGGIAVLLTAYGVPVGFHTMMRVIGGDSVASAAAVTPGGIGVDQALDVVSLRGAAPTATAGAYSIGEQLLGTAWNVTFAVALLVAAFGWKGGRRLVAQSYRAVTTRADTRAERTS
jgi:uncharacterized membrane protein YbhN (UPF0104 family)